MSRKDNRLVPGKSPLSYGGIRSESSILIFSNNRAPTTNDSAFLVGTMWIDSETDDTYILVDLSSGIAKWILFASPSAGVIEFTCDSGSALAAGGILNFVGDGNLYVSGTGNSMTIGLAQGIDGQIFIGSDAGAMALANITAGTGITVTNGANSISIEDNGGGGVIDLDTDSGLATPVADNIQIAGGTNITTVGAGDTLTINLNNNVTLAGTLTVSAFGVGVLQTDVSGNVFSDSDFNGTLLIGDSAGSPAWGEITSPAGTMTVTYPSANTIDIRNAGAVGITEFDTDSGTATAAANNINVYGGTNISTTAAGNHIDVELDANVTLSGTLTLPWTNGVLWTDSSGVVSSSNGSDGEVLIGGGAAPVWDAITSSSLTITNGANSIEIADSGAYPAGSLFNVSVADSKKAGTLTRDLIGNATWQNIGPDGTVYPTYSYDVLFDAGPNWTYWSGSTPPFFVAPVTGKYFFQFQIQTDAYFSPALITTTIDRLMSLRITATSRTYYATERTYTELSAGATQGDQYTICMDALVDMDYGDTAHFGVYMDYTGSSRMPDQIPIYGTYQIEAIGYEYSHMSGYVII